MSRKARRPSLTARMAAELTRVVFALETLAIYVPEQRSSPKALSPREALLPAVDAVVESARALVAEYQRRQGVEP